MRLRICAIGKLKDSGERALVERYVAMADATGRPLGLGPVELTELPEGRASELDRRRDDEALRLAKAAEGCEEVLLLDEGGRQMTSRQLARAIAQARDAGARRFAFLIGGPDGHGTAARALAGSRTLSLGRLTLPHGLARVVLAEQVYRATAILAGHPYHRD